MIDISNQDNQSSVKSEVLDGFCWANKADLRAFYDISGLIDKGILSL